MESDQERFGVFDATAYNEFYMQKFQEKKYKKSSHAHCIVPRCNTHENAIIDGKYINFISVSSCQSRRL